MVSGNQAPSKIGTFSGNQRVWLILSFPVLLDLI